MTENLRIRRALVTLLEELEDDQEFIEEMERELRVMRLKRAGLMNAVNGAYYALPFEDREDYYDRVKAMMRETYRGVRSNARLDTRQRAVIDILCDSQNRVLKVDEVQRGLEERGIKDLPRGYASAALKSLEKQGLCRKVRFARYEVNEGHPEILGRSRDQPQ
ncbi:hypothetical protein KHP62_09320 [Rhodobacteraceae bacterium NNCM2]|nr:hypothetical protein [Coraliihabitans acroporae]